AAEEIRSASASLSSAKAQRWPSLSTQSSATFIGNPPDAISLPAGALGAIPDGSPTGMLLPPQEVVLFESVGHTQYSFALKGAMPLFTWGKLSLGITLADTALDLAKLQYRKAVQETTLRIRGLYVSACYLSQALEALNTQQRIGERLMDLSEQSSRAGFLTASDLLGTQIALKEARLARAMLNEKLERILSDIARYTGIPELSQDQLALSPQSLVLVPWNRDDALARSAIGNLDVAMAELARFLRSGQSSLAKKQSYGLPDFGLQLELSYAGKLFPFIEEGWKDKDDWQFTLSLGAGGSMWPNKALYADVAKAEAEEAKAAALANEARRAVSAFIRESYLSLDLHKARIEYAALKQSSWASELAQSRALLDAGSGSESDYLKAMMQALGGLAEAYGSLAEYHSVLLGLEGALGDAAWVQSQ
ncbi:MAG TPA: TolC family protein, partial [Spirochaetales bacterium]|nr:TolC family protein [Spirochaetales bacterium]